ncbi:MAG: DUF58 domain-containing protein [Pseudomonadales bacterium]|jgi:hypothetical protein|nr:DUF58 domain-containing protein [Pseudomonadales bacterium]MDP7313159.1 DUF58 domain-containing protein [Pseudomonadales bacterium]MDP7577413.1 DUF58 domain-containing protein [Pseudomonadales bacterium]|tara:strand:- start:7224 stop:8549 length:1326 start_codon:yes stop_codon:yes gene_type:complete
MFRDWVYPGYVRAMRPKRPRKRTGTDRGRLVQTGAVICAVLGLNTDTSLVYQLFSLLFCLVVISRLTLRIHRPSVEIRRHLPRYATANQSFEYQIAVTNTGSSVESDLTIADNPTIRPPDREQFSREKEPGEDTRNAYDRFIGFHRFVYLQKMNTGITIKPQQVPDISLKATVNVTVEAEPMRRGIVQFSSTSVLHPDPLGLNHGVTLFDNPDSLIVLPKRYDVSKAFQIAGGRHFQPGGINASWSIGESDEFVSLRDYRDGDSLRKIHWASSAKRSKAVVKEYQDEYFVRQALILDTTNPDSRILEEAISVASSLMLVMNNSDSMLDLIYLSDKPAILTSGRGTSSVNEQLEILATLTHTDLGLDKLRETVAGHIQLLSGCILVLSNYTDEHQHLLQTLLTTNIAVEVFVVTDDESSLGDLPARYHILPVDQIQDRLSKL